MQILKIFIFPFSLFLLSGCWEKQSHEILAPEAAYYTLTGQTVDMAGGNPIHGITIIMNELQLTETDLDSTIHFGTKTQISDSDGRFRFDSVYVGRYILTFIRDGFTIQTKNFMQLHTARNEIYELAAIFSEGYLWNRDNGELISFCDNDSIALSMSIEDQNVTFYREMSTSWIYYSHFFNPVENTFDIDFGPIKDEVWIISNANGIQAISQLTYVSNSGWQVNEAQPLQPDELLPVSIKFWKDSLLVADIDNFYIYEMQDYKLIKQISVQEGLIITSIDRTDQDLWLFDKNTQYLYCCTSDLDVQNIYSVFIDGIKSRINDFAIDYSGRFWFTVK